jgi:cytochrome b subunit of formate dehydrogenase
MSTGLGIGYGSVLFSLLLVLVKVLFVVFVVALVAGIVVYIKNNIFTKEDIDSIKNTFSMKKPVNQKETCTACGRIIEAEWKLCPICGKEREL